MSPTRARGVWWTMATQKGRIAARRTEPAVACRPHGNYRQGTPGGPADRAVSSYPCTSRTEDGCQFAPGLGGNRHLIRQGFVPETPRARVGDIGLPP